MKTENVIEQGKLLSYDIGGTGTVVMLIHGFGETKEVWDDLIVSLKEKYKVIIPALPGTGASELPEITTIESMGIAMKAILDKECKEDDKAIVIGHSMGGYIALALAECCPEKLAGLGLFHSTAYADSKEKIVTREKAITFIEKNGTAPFIKNTAPDMFAPATKENATDIIQAYIATNIEINKETLIAYTKAMINRPDRTAVLKSIAVPVFFAIGEYDKAVPKDSLLQQVHLPETAHIEYFSASGHMGMLEQPELTKDTVLRFLQNL